MRSNKGYRPLNRLLLQAGSAFFVWVLVVVSGAASPAQAALILSVDHGDIPVAAVTDVHDGVNGFSIFEGMAAKGTTTFSRLGGSFSETYDFAGTFYGFTLTVAGFPHRIMDQIPDRFRFDLSHDLSTFGTIQLLPGAVAFQSSAPVKPLPSLPSSVLLFVPTLVGILGVALRTGSSVKSLDRGIESQTNQIPAIHSILILVLSPDVTFATNIEGQLCRAGYPGRVVSSAHDVLTIAHRTPPSLVLVDHRVGDWDMLRTDSTLRHVPMIALVPSGSLYTEESCLADLERGMDGMHDARDGHRLLVAKVGTYLRRAGHDVSRRGLYRIGTVELDADIREVKVGGRRIQLSAKPFVLLEAFMRAPSKVFSRGELVDLVWGPNFAIGDHTLDVHVHALRQLLQHDPDHLCRLMTIKGVGFKLKSFSPAMSASSVPDVLPMAVNSLPLLRPGMAHTSNTQRSLTSSTPGSRQTRLRRIPRKHQDRALQRESSVRHLRSAVSVG
jgi:DNA-binding response OmpR family regulator